LSSEHRRAEAPPPPRRRHPGPVSSLRPWDVRRTPHATLQLYSQHLGHRLTDGGRATVRGRSVVSTPYDAPRRPVHVSRVIGPAGP
jgi:hypothetical protein